MGIVNSSTNRTNLSIQESQDKDKFQFTFDKNQNIDSIKIAFQHLVTDIDVEISNRDSLIPILEGKSLSNNEDINIASLPSGDYDLTVFSHNNQIGNYSIIFEDLLSC